MLLLFFAISLVELNSSASPSVVQSMNVQSRVTALRELLGSYLVTHQMDGTQVEKLMGLPFGVDTHGPPGEFYTVYSYMWSGINVTFGPNGKVQAVERGRK